MRSPNSRPNSTLRPNSQARRGEENRLSRKNTDSRKNTQKSTNFKPLSFFFSLFVFSSVDAPPSYAGSLLKYSYKLTVSIQRVGGSIRQVRIPFRVLVLYGLCDYQGADESPLPSNPFLDSSQSANKHNAPKQSVKDGSIRYDMSSNNELALSSSHHNSNLLDLASDLQKKC